MTITATTPAHALGTVDVTVATGVGTSATSAADEFTYANLPVVTGVSPSTGSAGGGTSVTVTGYCLWAFTIDRNGLGVHHLQLWIQLSVVPVVIAVLYVLLQLDAGRGGTPEDLVLKDRVVQACCVVWAILLVIGIYA